MVQSRNAITILFLLISLFTALFIVYLLTVEPASWGSWSGLAIGGVIGIVSCFSVERMVRKNTSGDQTNNQVIQNHDVSTYASRWMIPSVVAGMLLAKLVASLFSSEIQDLINNFIFAWIVVAFSYGAVLIWRFMPD